ncbi:oligosaccharide flippase family protein [Acidobacteriota bacterium]
MKAFRPIRRLIQHKDIFKVAFGNYGGALLAFICSIIVARYLGPESFGLLVIFLAISPIVFELTGYGLDSTLVKYATPEISRNPGKAAKLFNIVLLWKIGLNVVFILLGFTVVGPLIVRASGSNTYAHIAQLAIIMGAGMSMWRYALSVFQCLQSFSLYVATSLIHFAARLFLVLLGCFFLSFDVNGIMWIYIGAVFLASIFGMLARPSRYSFRQFDLRDSYSTLKDINKLSIWIVLSTLIFISAESMNVFMVEYYLGNHAVGIFGAALVLGRAMEHLVVSIKTVLLPETSLLTTHDEYVRYIKKCLKITLPLAVILLPVLLVSGFVIPLCFSEKFANAVVIFNVIFWAYWISLIVDPIWLLFISSKRTNYYVYSDLLILLVIFTCNIYFLPRYGPLGAAYSLVLGRISGRCLLGLLLHFLLKNRKKCEAGS